MPAIPTDEWLTVDQAAQYLGVTRRAVHKYVQQGKLPAYKSPIGGRTLFRRPDLLEFKTPRLMASSRRDEAASPVRAKVRPVAEPTSRKPRTAGGRRD